MKDKYKDQIATANKRIIIATLAILIYEIPALRHLIGIILTRIAFIMRLIPFIKGLCNWASTVNLRSIIYDYYFIVEIPALAVIIISIIFKNSINKKKSAHDETLRIAPASLLHCDSTQNSSQDAACDANNSDSNKPASTLTGFQSGLLTYLTAASSQRAYLISGQWGSGKTHALNEFMDTFYSESATKRYRISCFGLSTREEIIDAINKEIKKADDSLFSKIIDLLGLIPVIGDFLKDNLSKSYSYTSAPKNSIFIFDDFERITSRSIDTAQSLLHHSPDEKATTVINVSDAASFEGSIDNGASSFDKYMEKLDYDKYIAIVGLMNELVETYNMKVIILCCSDMLGEAFVSNVLRLKLNCIEYVKEPSQEARKSIISEAIEDFTIASKDKEEDIEKFVQNLPIDVITKYEPFNNLRLFRNLIDAFLHTANTLDRGLMNQEFFESLFASIAVTHICVFRNDTASLRCFDNGANICLLLDTYKGPFDTCRELVKELYGNNTRWVSRDVSGYWILNRGKRSEKELKRICDQWNQYEDKAHEKKLLRFLSHKPEDIHSVTQYIYCFIAEHPSDESLLHKMLGDDFMTYYEKAIESYEHITLETIAEILDKLSCARYGRELDTLANKIVECLMIEDAPTMVHSNSEYAKVYNEEVKRRKEMEELCKDLKEGA